jgi:putative nucleotidyltransferase with HDIG domain
MRACVGESWLMQNLSEISLTLLAAIALLYLHINRARLGFFATLGFLILSCSLTFAFSVTPYLHASPSTLYLTQFGLTLILIFDGIKRWRSSLIVILAVAVLCSAALSLSGHPASQRAIVDTLSLLVAGFLMWIVFSQLQSSSFVRMYILFAIAGATDLILQSLLISGQSAPLETRLLLMVLIGPGFAWYLERTSFEVQSVNPLNAASYKALMGTLAVIAQGVPRTSSRDAVTTFFDTAEVLTRGNEDDLYPKLLDSALSLIPGAQAGSLRLRHGETFRWVAQRGHDDLILNLEVSINESLEFHGDPLGWYRGTPVIRARPLFHPSINSKLPISSQSVKSVMVLPILVGHEVVAEISLDNFQSEKAFAEESVAAARQFALQAAALIAAKREQLNLEARLQEFEVLENVTGALHNAHSLEDICERVTLETVRLIGSQHASVVLVSEDARSLKVQSSWGLFKFLQHIFIPRGNGLSWSAIDSRRMVETQDTQRDPRNYAPHVSSPLPPHSQLTTPLFDSNGTALGALLCARDLPAQFTELDKRLVNVIAKVTASALERVRVTEDLERRVLESQTLLALSHLLESTDPQLVKVALKRIMELGAADLGVIGVMRDEVLQLEAHTGKISSELLESLQSGSSAEEMSFVNLKAQQGLDIPLSELEQFSGLINAGLKRAFIFGLETEGAPRIIGLFRNTDSPWTKNERNLIESGTKTLAALLSRLERLSTLEAAYEGALLAVGRALEARDLETSDHTERVAQLAERMARALKLDESEIRAIRWGAYLHDVGKFSIPDTILHKKGALTLEERGFIQTHPFVGYNLIRTIPFLPESSRSIVLHHHERWDGSGYPNGLKTDNIPLSARIFAVCDVFDALSHKRTYKEAMNLEQSMIELRVSAENGHLEMRLVQVLEDLLGSDAKLRDFMLSSTRINSNDSRLN